MRTYTLVVILIFVAMFTGGISLFVGESNANYHMNLTDSDLKTFDKINKTQSLATDMGEQIKSSGVQESDSLTTFVKGGFSAAKLLFGLPDLFLAITVDAMNTVNKYTGLPVVFQAGISALVFVVIVFGFLYAVFKIKF